jgi:hypothetical protein
MHVWIPQGRLRMAVESTAFSAQAFPDIDPERVDNAHASAAEHPIVQDEGQA